MEALDLVGAGAEGGVDPLPDDLVAVGDVNLDRVLHDGRAGLRRLDEDGLARNGGRAELLSGQ